uniref:DUF4218 domain-containing protein n=1 Tax=Populus trichocarpa TaxID=3694 RepID=A0A2K2A3S9_POPTR
MKLEMIFPPSFFDSMEHLPIHLPFEAKAGGPVQYRWMYPFERLDITVAMQPKNPKGKHFFDLLHPRQPPPSIEFFSALSTGQPLTVIFPSQLLPSPALTSPYLHRDFLLPLSHGLSLSPNTAAPPFPPTSSSSRPNRHRLPARRRSFLLLWLPHDFGSPKPPLIILFLPFSLGLQPSPTDLPSLTRAPTGAPSSAHGRHRRCRNEVGVKPPILHTSGLSAACVESVLLSPTGTECPQICPPAAAPLHSVACRANAISHRRPPPAEKGREKKPAAT